MVEGGTPRRAGSCGRGCGGARFAGATIHGLGRATYCAGSNCRDASALPRARRYRVPGDATGWCATCERWGAGTYPRGEGWAFSGGAPWTPSNRRDSRRRAVVVSSAALTVRDQLAADTRTLRKSLENDLRVPWPRFYGGAGPLSSPALTLSGARIWIYFARPGNAGSRGRSNICS